jgi:DNA-binding response OmpR family regulator
MQPLIETSSSDHSLASPSDGKVSDHPTAPMLRLISAQMEGVTHRRYRGHILIADHDLPTREDVATFLRQRGFRVWVATTANEVQAMIAHRMPSLLLLEIALPAMSGVQLLHTLRTQHSTALLPIIIVSARNTTSDIRHGLSLGADDYMTKPLELSLVEARINALLRRDARTRLAYASESWVEDTLAFSAN